MFAPTTYANAGYPSIRNPFGLEAYADVFNVADMVLEPLLLVVVGFGAAALVFRLRTANGVRRQQLKWLAYGAALMTLSFLVSSLAKILPVLAPVNEPLAVLALAYVWVRRWYQPWRTARLALLIVVPHLLVLAWLWTSGTLAEFVYDAVLFTIAVLAS